LSEVEDDKSKPKQKVVVPDLQYKARSKTLEHSSQLAEQAKMCQELRLSTEKKILLDEVESDISSFDKEIEDLKNDKIKLEYEMKMANMK